MTQGFFLLRFLKSSMSDLLYRVKLAKPNAHLFEVTLTIPEPDEDGQLLSLPAWIPGSYMIRDFAKNIVRIRAGAGGRDVGYRKIDKSSWRFDPVGGPLSVVYEVYAWDLSVRSAHFDATHAYFNGTSLFLRVHGQDAGPCVVEIDQGESAQTRGWRVATSMPALPANGTTLQRYQADNYADLIEHPVEIGDLAEIEFQAASVPHRVAVYGRQNADLSRLARDLKTICETHVRMFGELPLDRYLFLVMTVGEGYGGLEHTHSTSLLCSRNDLPVAKDDTVTKEYRRFLGLCSHEYFHLWNVKRIKPAVFQNPTLSAETHTSLLWVFEGFTAYYDELALVRSGCIDANGYLELLAETITRVMRTPGRHKQSVAESSFDAWTKFYKQDENAPNAIVSYYGKGALVALSLDLTLRLRTKNACTLDDVMRVLWQEYGKTGKGVEEGDVETVAERLSGLDLQPFFAQAVYGTEDLPLQDLLAQVGVDFRLRSAKDDKDFGGLLTDSEPAKPFNYLGVRLAPGSAAVVSHVFENTAAWNAGIAAGDELLAVNGLRVNAANLASAIKRLNAGQNMVLHLFRRDELMQLDVQLQTSPLDTCELCLMPAVSGAAKEIRDSWLGAPGD